MKIKLFPTLVVLSFSFLLSACNKPNPQTQLQPEKSQEIKNEQFSQKSTIKNLLGLEKNLVCVYNYVDKESNFQVKGVTYISGKKFAQETETIDPSDSKKILKSNMFSDNEFIYTWSPDKKDSGMKIKIEKSESDDGTTKTDIASAKESMDKEYDVNCSPWSVDDKKFTLPSDVKFTDLSELMKNIPSAPTIPPMPN